VGIAEAAMLMACTLGATFSMLIPMRSETTSMGELVRQYGLSSRLASIEALELTTAEMIGGLTCCNCAWCARHGLSPIGTWPKL
jgi:Asp/Glu/hydantoin racemase